MKNIYKLLGVSIIALSAIFSLSVGDVKAQYLPSGDSLKIISAQVQQNFSTNETPSFRDVIAKEVDDNSPAEYSEGFNVQAFIANPNDLNTKGYIQSLNATYDSIQKTWSGKFNLITTPGDYVMDIILYCSQQGSICAKKYGDPAGGNTAGQFVYKAYFTVSSSTPIQPIITSIEPQQASVGSIVTIRGSGLSFAGSVMATSVTFNNPTTDSGTTPTTVSFDGKTITFVVPNLPVGSYNITIEGVGIDRRSNSVPFQISALNSCYVFNTNLQLGSRGADVIALQNFLINKGFAISDLSHSDRREKGYFGRSTFQALIKYQTSVGLPATGFFGPLTRAKVNGDCGSVILTNPSITVTSPNGGEKWQQGSVQNITWNSKDSAGLNVNIYVDTPYTSPVVCVKAPCVASSAAIIENITNSGVYKWNVGDAQVKGGLPNGPYYIRVCSSLNKNNCDSSDSPFTITSSIQTVSVTNASSQYTPTTPVDNTYKGSYSFTFTLNNLLDHDIYISKSINPVIFVNIATVNGPVSTSITNISVQNPVIVSGDTSTSYVIHAGTFRVVTVSGGVDNTNGTAGTKNLAIDAITYSAFPSLTPSVTMNKELVGISGLSLSFFMQGVPSTQTVSVITPNGGETWTKDTTQTIKWNDTTTYQTFAAIRYDIKLAPFYPPCTGTVCPAYPYIAPYLVATGVTGSSYEWKVGLTKGDAIAPDGSYTVQVCQTGTSVCDSSDSYFKITSNITPNIPYISSVTTPGIGSQIWITGAYLNNLNSYVYRDGIKDSSVSFTSSMDGTTVSFPISSNWTAGSHSIQLENNNGKSNVVWVTIGGTTQPSTLIIGPGDQTATFTKTFRADSSIGSSLSIMADNSYSVSINGKNVGVSNEEINFYTPKTYDISSYVNSGSNTLEITIVNLGGAYGGWDYNPGGVIYKITGSSNNTLAASDGTEQTTSSVSSVSRNSTIVTARQWSPIPGAEWIWNLSLRPVGTAPISEQVKCVFNGSSNQEKCYSTDGKYNFSGIGTAVGTVTGNKGDTITWKSSCGGYVDTTIDGNSEYANFTCAQTQPTPAVLSISPNSPASTTVRVTDLVNGTYNGLPLLAFRIKTSTGNLSTISYLKSLTTKFSIPGNLTAAYLYDGSTLISSAKVSGGITTFSNIDLAIPANTTREYLIKVDVNGVNTGSINVSASVVSSDLLLQDSNSNNLAINGSVQGNYMTVENPTIVTTTTSAPTIISFTGPASLNTNDTSTWTVQATDPQMGTLGYTVEWGSVCPAGARCAPIEVTETKPVASPVVINKMATSKPALQTMSFTHAYSGAGTYTVKITARNSAGLTSEASTTVKVTEVRSAPTALTSTKQTSSIWDSIKSLFGF